MKLSDQIVIRKCNFILKIIKDYFKLTVWIKWVISWFSFRWLKLLFFGLGWMLDYFIIFIWKKSLKFRTEWTILLIEGFYISMLVIYGLKRHH